MAPAFYGVYLKSFSGVNKPYLSCKMILITGADSGLGKFLCQELKGIPLTRNTSAQEKSRIFKNSIDTIIHCAFNSTQSIALDFLFRYVDDNLLLTRELISIPHQKFIYLSTTDTYPKTNSSHSETERIEVENLQGIYPVTKLMSESLVAELSKNHLILRPTAMLGKYSRKNSLIRIKDEENCTLTLSEESTFNYVLHSDILEFIKIAINKDLQGIYNLASSENVTLSSVAQMLEKKVKFGSFNYMVGNINQNKASSVCSNFEKTSTEMIENFIKDTHLLIQ